MSKIYNREFGKKNLKSLMQSLYSTNEYCIRIEKGQSTTFEEGYRREAIDPDGNARDLTSAYELQRIVGENQDIFDFIKDLESDNKNNTFLDIGCGCGPFLMHIDGTKWSKYGVECSKFATEEAQSNSPDSIVMNIPFEDNSFDEETLLHFSSIFSKFINMLYFPHDVI